MRKNLITPYGGTLAECLVPPPQARSLAVAAREYPSWDLTERQLLDIELLLNGGFSPLSGFMGEADYDRVVREMRLAQGILWPIPVTLDVTEAFAQRVKKYDAIALRDPEGVLIAVMEITDLWRPDKHTEATQVFGTDDVSHPGVHYLFNVANPVYLGGRLQGVELPQHYDFKSLRHTPRELRERFGQEGSRQVVGFHTRAPMHRLHERLIDEAAKGADRVLIHPVVGMSQPGDVDHFARVRCYEHVVKRYMGEQAALSLLPLAVRMAGPREALWHAIIRQNYGCTHFIVGKNHGGAVKNAAGRHFYGPHDAQELLRRHQDELQIEMVPVKEIAPEEASGRAPATGKADPAWAPLIADDDVAGVEWHPEVASELDRVVRPKHEQGFTIFFTGLSGAGKSTIAKTLQVKLMERGGRSVTLLDGDIVRKHLSNDLGFSREHRNINVMRIGFVASQITKHGGIAICAPIAPYANMRRRVRDMIAAEGGFVEIYIATPLDVCESRDRKGLYAKARAGLIPEFTGVSDPYEVPQNPEITIDTRGATPEEAAAHILQQLETLGYVK